MKIRLIDVLFWISFMLAIIFILWYLFGDSPTLEQTLIVFLLSAVLKVYKEFYDFKGEIRTSFGKVKDDMDYIKNKLDGVF